jgi:[ribosomal protein S5]-alanine N-acetyltransferase
MPPQFATDRLFSMTELQTKRLRLMQWCHADFASFRPIAKDPDVMRYISDGIPWSDEGIREFVGRQMRHAAATRFCLWRIARKPDGKTIGFCGLQPLRLEDRREVEIGWWLAKNCWGRGIASEAARAVMRFAFAEANLGRVIAIARPENMASIRIMRKLGMRFEREAAHKGISVVVYSIERTPTRNN